MREGTGDGVDRWAKPLDTWLALFLNLRQGRHGPVIQDRPKTVYMPPDRDLCQEMPPQQSALASLLAMTQSETLSSLIA